MTLVQATVIYTPPLFYTAKGLWYIKQNKSSTVTLYPYASRRVFFFFHQSSMMT